MLNQILILNSILMLRLISFVSCFSILVLISITIQIVSPVSNLSFIVILILISKCCFDCSFAFHFECDLYAVFVFYFDFDFQFDVELDLYVKFDFNLGFHFWSMCCEYVNMLLNLLRRIAGIVSRLLKRFAYVYFGQCADSLELPTKSCVNFIR